MALSTLKSLLQVKRLGLLLAGHGVAKTFVSEEVEQVHISRENFIDSLDYLKELDFYFASTEELSDHLAGRNIIQKHWVHLGMDDGYRNNHSTIWPIVRERNIPIAVYTTVNQIESQDYFPTFWLRFYEFRKKPWEKVIGERGLHSITAQSLFEDVLRFGHFEQTKRIVERIKDALNEADLRVLSQFENDRPMTVAMVKEMAKDPLVHIGSHSHDHIVMHKAQDEELVRSNLSRSYDTLTKDWHVTQNPTFCFPNGDTSPRWQDIAQETGYALSFGCDSAFITRRSNPNFLPRFWLHSRQRLQAVLALGLLGNWALPFAAAGHNALRSIRGR